MSFVTAAHPASSSLFPLPSALSPHIMKHELWRPLADDRGGNFAAESAVRAGQAIKDGERIEILSRGRADDTNNCDASGAGLTVTTCNDCNTSSPHSPLNTRLSVSATWLQSCSVLRLVTFRFVGERNRSRGSTPSSGCTSPQSACNCLREDFRRLNGLFRGLIANGNYASSAHDSCAMLSLWRHSTAMQGSREFPASHSERNSTRAQTTPPEDIRPAGPTLHRKDRKARRDSRGPPSPL